MFSRASQLRCIRLDHCNEISKEGLIELGTKLPLLEELDISMDFYPGLCLPHKLQLFHVLQFEFAADCNDDAFAIAKTMPKLRRLNISGNALNDVGLLAILDGCPLLESLDLEGCFNISESLEDRCYDQIKDLRLSDFWSKICFCEKYGMSSESEDSSYHSSDSDSSYHSSDSVSSDSEI
jgi:F-box/leucine-rich repeat protein 2/20